jgi:hypothetical protein
VQEEHKLDPDRCWLASRGPLNRLIRQSGWLGAAPTDGQRSGRLDSTCLVGSHMTCACIASQTSDDDAGGLPVDASAQTALTVVHDVSLSRFKITRYFSVNTTQ